MWANMVCCPKPAMAPPFGPSELGPQAGVGASATRRQRGCPRGGGREWARGPGAPQPRGSAGAVSRHNTKYDFSNLDLLRTKQRVIPTASASKLQTPLPEYVRLCQAAGMQAAAHCWLCRARHRYTARRERRVERHCHTGCPWRVAAQTPPGWPRVRPRCPCRAPR